MLASAETMSPPTQAGLYFDPPLLDRATFATGLKPQPSFKKHKHLPRPKQTPSSVNPKLRTPHPLSVDTTLSSVSSLSSRSATISPSPAPLRPDDVRASGGPDLPPTPPAHSRTSSSGQSVQPSSPTYVETPKKSVASNSDAQRTPGTPPNQRSPPTPEVTPPQLAKRPKAFRPSLADRMPSKATNESRTASFTTARETPYSSEDEKAVLRRISSERTSSQNTVRQISDVRNNKKTQNIGLGLGLESDDNSTPRLKQDFVTFDGEWGSGSEVEQEWDDNLNRNVIVRKRRTQPDNKLTKDRRDKPAEVIEDEAVTPTNATKALQTMPLQQRMHVASSPTIEPVDQGSKRWAAPSASASSVSTDVKRFSGMSSKSTVSTVVEAILVDAPPQRQKTLRHVKKQTTLRDSASDVSQSSSAANSTGLGESSRRLRPRDRPPPARSESLASTATMNSLSSRKARRDVWKNGGIPVVVIPDRKASVKGAATPSLRSTSSRRSQRSNSMGSVPLSGVSRTKDSTPVFERPKRRSRAMSESDGSLPGDQRTIDYPPMVPVRSSSLSAPTSRNGSVAGSRAGSRSGSLTSESLKAHNTFVHDEQQKQQQLRQALQNPPRVKAERAPSVEYIPAESDFHHERQLQPAPSVESHRDANDQRSLVDHNGDPFFGKRLTTQNTPFSIASVETNGTHSAAEVSEAMAVNIYPHQNRSVVMVDHTSKILDANTLQTDNLGTKDSPPEKSNTTTAAAPDGVPVTPPQPIFTVDDVDSPLRNPRAPPEPPVIALIPATPSGLTPAAEQMKMLGNYFEETPEKRPSVLKRAFSAFLTRTFSLSRNLRKGNVDNPSSASGQRPALYRSSTSGSIPDEGRLHPHWRPLSSQWDPDMDEDWVRDIDDDDMDTVYRYPPIDNRPSSRRPSLSSRMKRTFAILPITDDAHYTTPDGRGVERRTIKRTPSGNLRVMRYRDSLSSMRWGRRSSEDGRPSTAPDSSSSPKPSRRTWGAEKRFDAQGRRFFPGWQDKLEGCSPQALGRRLSERRRQKRSQELRSKISGPREVRDGVGEVIKRNSYKGPSYQASPHISLPGNTGVSGQQEQAQQRQSGPRRIERSPKIQAQV
ncbi:hypothetical protein PG997_003055 [Apiospora hydei]|uniref:Uncharacterized protein n=1 Tax=Apiospora hydei TaxID=1337664 RepID=A0ABR1WY71_9PEZI